MSSTAAVIVLLVITESVSSYLEGNVGEFQFTIPDANRSFNDAVSSCNANYSTLAVINDTYIQTALTQFLSSSSVNYMVYINAKLYQTTVINTWYLLDGSRYYGDVADQNPREANYLLYCRLRYDQSRFIVAASNPSDNRSYICAYEDARCLNNSSSDARYNGKCYVKYENESLTWFQTKERCINSGGNLATFQSNPNDRLAPQLNTSWLNPSFTYWVGIRWNNSMLKSPDGGSEAIYTSWSTGKPNNFYYQCVCADPKGIPPWSWTDCDCNARQFVCLKTVPTTTVLTTTVATTTSTVIVTSKATNAIQSNQSNSTTNALAIGLGAGIGGGLFLILLITIVIVAITITRKRRRKSDGVETRYKVENTGATTEPNAGPTAPAIPDIYAQILVTDHHPTNNKPKIEVIYAKPEFVTKHNSTSSDSDPTTVRQGNVKSIMLGGPSDFSVSTTSLS